MQHTIISKPVKNVFGLPAYAQKATARPNTLERFMLWCEKQEENRFLWLGISLMCHIGMVLPLTLLSILFFANNNFILWTIALCANVPVLALNLAAQPPKVTLPVLFASLSVNAVIIILSITMLFI